MKPSNSDVPGVLQLARGGRCDPPSAGLREGSP